MSVLLAKECHNSSDKHIVFSLAPGYKLFNSIFFVDEEEEETETVSQKSPSRPGTNIHLWQFVKELLLQPSLYGNYIHWIDRAKGIFKIVDSVKVATLWGKRKVRLRPGKI